MNTNDSTPSPETSPSATDADRIRHRLADSGTLMVNVIAAPGAGKTALLGAIVARLKSRMRVAVLEGDVASDVDAEQIWRLGIPSRQILTGKSCHLEARHVRHELEHLGAHPFDLIFVENVGNLVCPAEIDLGEDFKLGLISVSQGAETPAKYPALFERAAITVVTKVDLLPHVFFDLDSVRRQIAALNPKAVTLIASARSGEGIELICSELEQRLASKRQAAGVDLHRAIPWR
jgi:hydrogenase nickel incorporation protein HypB